MPARFAVCDIGTVDMLALTPRGVATCYRRDELFAPSDGFPPVQTISSAPEGCRVLVSAALRFSQYAVSRYTFR